MMLDQNLPDLQKRKDLAPKLFDPRSATPFVNKSVSEETRRAYRKTVADFFQFVGGKHPAEVVPVDVLRWRDHLRAGRKRPATVSFKLSVIRSFFEYLKAGGVIPLNPASTNWSHHRSCPQNQRGVRSQLKRSGTCFQVLTWRSRKGQETMHLC
jgi:site-specific recombinase XerC